MFGLKDLSIFLMLKFFQHYFIIMIGIIMMAIFMLLGLRLCLLLMFALTEAGGMLVGHGLVIIVSILLLAV